VTVLGLPLVLANLNRIAVEITEVAEPAGLAAGAERIRDAWVANIESEGLVLTGHYRDSVRVVSEESVTAVVTDVDYARFLEFGTSYIEAHPVAERAFDEHADAALDAIADNVRRVLR